jgi:hypothetical protein
MSSTLDQTLLPATYWKLPKEENVTKFASRRKEKLALCMDAPASGLKICNWAVIFPLQACIRCKRLLRAGRYVAAILNSVLRI